MIMRTLLLLLIAILPATVSAALSVTFQAMDATCAYANGFAIAFVSGGTQPYTYQWSNGSTDFQILNVPAGNYSVLVTDALGEEATGDVMVLSQPYLMLGGGGYSFCTAPTNVFEDPMVGGQSQAPWYVDGFPAWLMVDGSGRYAFGTGGGSGEEYTISDANGCTGTITTTGVAYVGNWPALSVTDVEPACDLVADGSITVHSAGPAPGISTWIHLVSAGGVDQFQAYQPDQNGDVFFTGLEPGYYGMHWWLGHTAEAADPGECSYDTLWVTVPDLSPFCGSVSGTSWYDVDGDCVQDANEAGVPYSPLLIQPGGEIAITNGSGEFVFGVADGNYTLEQTDPTLVPICPAAQPVPFSVLGDQQTIDLANGSTLPLDLSVDLVSGVFRPGFQTSYAIYARNLSPQVSGPVQLTAELDPNLVFMAASVAPTSVAGQSLSWDIGSLGSFAMQTVVIYVQVPVGTALGIGLSTSASASNTLAEYTLANNTSTELNVVVGSYDPNDKRAVTSTRASEELYFINEDEWIDYTIRFQNTGTFSADFVVITDTIAPELDMLTFEQGAASHPFTVNFKPGRVIEWRFDDIQLPDSASDEAGSHGLVKLRMRPKLPLFGGTVIQNVANIFFDYNEPVITEPSVLVAEFSTGVDRSSTGSGRQLTLLPNPVSDELRISANNSIGWLRVIAADGREVLVRSVTATNASIAVDKLQAGTYLLIATFTDGTEARERFIKH